MRKADGSGLMGRIIEVIKAHVPEPATRRVVYVSIIDVFEDYDWIFQDECKGQDAAWDDALNDLHPEWDDEE